MLDFRMQYGAALPERPIWARAIARPPMFVDWVAWQYADDGTVDGIDGPVDLNVLAGGLESLLPPP